MADFARSGAFTPYTALFNVTGQPAISVPAGFGEDGLPTNVQLVGQAARRGHAAPARRPARDRAAARRPPPRARPAARPTAPSTAASARGWTPSASASAVPARRAHRHREQLRLVPGRQRRRAGERLVAAQQRAQQRRGDAAAAGGGGARRAAPARRPRGASARRARRARSGRARSLAGPLERRQHAVGDVVGPDRLGPRPAAPGQRHRGQPGQPLEAGQPAVAGRVDERGREGRGAQGRLVDRPLGQRLGPVQAAGWCGVAPSAEKKTKCSTPACSAARSSRQVATPAELLDRRVGLVAVRAPRGGRRCARRAAPGAAPAGRSGRRS